MRRTLLWAFALSALMHVWLMLPLGHWLAFDIEEEAPPARMEAVLLPAPAPPKPVAPKPSPRAKPAAAKHAAPAPSAVSEPQATPVVTEPPVPVVEAAPVPQGFVGAGQIEFEVSKGEGRFVLGRAVHSWYIENGMYQIDSKVRATGLISLFNDVQLSQHSHGRVEGSTLVPDLFVDVRKDKRYQATFRWGDAQVDLDRGTQAILRSGTQDLISLLYQLGRYDLKGESITVPVTNGRKLVAYTFTIHAETVMLADDSAHAAYRLHYQGSDGEGLEVWLADAAGHLPLRIRYLDRKGGTTELLAVRNPQPDQEPKP